MVRHEEEFKALQKAHEQRLAQRKAQKKIEHDISRRKEYARRCNKLVSPGCLVSLHCYDDAGIFEG